MAIETRMVCDCCGKEVDDLTGLSSVERDGIRFTMSLWNSADASLYDLCVECGDKLAERAIDAMMEVIHGA